MVFNKYFQIRYLCFSLVILFFYNCATNPYLKDKSFTDNMAGKLDSRNSTIADRVTALVLTSNKAYKLKKDCLNKKVDTSELKNQKKFCSEALEVAQEYESLAKKGRTLLVTDLFNLFNRLKKSEYAANAMVTAAIYRFVKYGNELPVVDPLEIIKSQESDT